MVKTRSNLCSLQSLSMGQRCYRNYSKHNRMVICGCAILVWTILIVFVQCFIIHKMESQRKKMAKIFVNNTNKPQTRQKLITITWFRLYHKILAHHTTLFDWGKCGRYSNCKLIFRTIPGPRRVLKLHTDAVLFQGNNLYSTELHRRDSDQVFVFVSYEPPAYMHSDLFKSPQWDEIFNWTMTYRLDSDIQYRYGEFIKTERNTTKHKNYTKIFQEKRKMAVWIVSHCNTSSKRETYVEKLKDYIDVETYGDCFEGKECSRTNQNECFDYIEKTYKFYLAFENSFCQDYITEKAYNWTTRNIIVVVRGPPGYHRHLPRGSYVDTRDFRTVKELAYFLLDIAYDEKQYIKYLQASEGFVLRSMYNQPQIAYCKLCEKLNNLNANRKSYKSISNWWDGKGVCWNATDIT